jgi:hypothetical protein
MISPDPLPACASLRRLTRRSSSGQPLFLARRPSSGLPCPSTSTRARAATRRPRAPPPFAVGARRRDQNSARGASASPVLRRRRAVPVPPASPTLAGSPREVDGPPRRLRLSPSPAFASTHTAQTASVRCEPLPTRRLRLSHRFLRRPYALRTARRPPARATASTAPPPLLPPPSPCSFPNCRLRASLAACPCSLRHPALQGVGVPQHSSSLQSISWFCADIWSEARGPAHDPNFWPGPSTAQHEVNWA